MIMATGLDDMLGINKIAEIQKDSLSGEISSTCEKIGQKPMIYHEKNPIFKERTSVGDSDEYLSQIIQQMRARTIIIGVGGAGNNAISRIQEVGVEYAETLAVNTDAQDLFYANSDKKLLIGKGITCGLGAGNDPRKGEMAAKADIARIIPFLDRDVVFIACGLGGGTGTGASPIIAKEAKARGALVVTFCTLPFRMESKLKRIIANKGLRKLAQYSDTIVPLPNEKLLKLIPDLSLLRGFKVMDEILVRSVKGIVDLVSKCGLVNLDLADIREILKKRANCSGIIGMSEINLKYASKDGKTSKRIPENEIIELLKRKTLKALQNPLLNPETSKIMSCLVSIQGGPELSLSQVNEIVSTVSKNISPAAKLKFGAMIEPRLESIKITIIGLGPESIYLKQAKHIQKDEPSRTVAEFVL